MVVATSTCGKKGDYAKRVHEFIIFFNCFNNNENNEGDQEGMLHMPIAF